MRKTMMVFTLSIAFLLTGCGGNIEPTPDSIEYWIAFHKANWPYEDWVFWTEMDLGDMERTAWDPHWSIWLAENWDDILWVEWDIEAWRDFLIVDFPFDPFPEWITYTTEFEAYHIDEQYIHAFLSISEDLYIGYGYGFRLAVKAGDDWIRFPLRGVILDIRLYSPPGWYVADTIINDYYRNDYYFYIRENQPHRQHTNFSLFMYTDMQLVPGTYRMYRSFSVSHERFGSPVWQGYVWTEFVVYE